MDSNNNNNNKVFVLYKCIMANTSVMYGSKLHLPPTNWHLLAAQQERYKKQNKQKTSNEKCLRVFWKNVRTMDH